MATRNGVQAFSLPRLLDVLMLSICMVSMVHHPPMPIRPWHVRLQTRKQCQDI